MATTTTPQDIERAFQALSLNAQDPEAVTILAEASKEDTRVRARLADPQTLKTLIEIIESGLSHSLPTADRALRCLGNACAENNEARDAVTAIGFSWAVLCFQSDDEGIKTLTTKVLYNICSDHEASQQQCYRDKLQHELVLFLDSDSTIKGSEYDFAIDVLFWLTGHKAALEPTLSDPLPSPLVVDLLRLPQAYAEHCDLDNFASLAESVLVYLRDTTIQQQVVELQEFMEIWRTLELVEDRAATVDPQIEEGVDDLKVLAPLCTNLIWCMSDIAARPDFARAYSADVVRPIVMEIDNDHHPTETSGLADHLIEYIKRHAADSLDSARGTDGSLYTASCEVLGNLLWGSDPSYAHLVSEEQLHKPLFQRVIQCGSAKSFAPVLHSICGLLIHLTRPSRKVREEMGSHPEALPALKILCRHEMIQIKQDSVKLLKALGKDCMRNQQRFTDLAEEVLQAIRDSHATASEGGGAITSPS